MSYCHWHSPQESSSVCVYPHSDLIAALLEGNLNIHTYMYTCTHTYIHTHVHTHTYTHIHMYTHIHKYICTYTCHIYTETMHTHTMGTHTRPTHTIYGHALDSQLNCSPLSSTHENPSAGP